MSIASEAFASQEFPEEERHKLAQRLKGIIDVITELKGTDSDDFDEILFSAMKLVVVKWKASVLSGKF
jgi:Asp-tRNA(Asn)/Glu-tRNA(Gln) amidotransferase C subunit